MKLLGRQYTLCDRGLCDLVALIVICPLIVSCAGGEALKSQASSITVELNRAQNPAYRCEEKALAHARAHLSFLEIELSQGDYFTAKSHLEKALFFQSCCLDR